MSKEDGPTCPRNDVPYDVLLDSPIQYRLDILQAFTTEYQNRTNSNNSKLGIAQLSSSINLIYDEWSKKKDSSFIDALSNFANSKEPFQGKPKLNNYSTVTHNLSDLDKLSSDDLKAFAATVKHDIDNLRNSDHKPDPMKMFEQCQTFKRSIMLQQNYVAYRDFCLSLQGAKDFSKIAIPQQVVIDDPKMLSILLYFGYQTLTGGIAEQMKVTLPAIAQPPCLSYPQIPQYACYQPITYQLHVRVVEAADIAKMDANSTDAYCVLATSSDMQKTRVIKNSMHPKWEQDFHFTIETPTIGSLDILMKDKDIVKDDKMATLSIPFSSLIVGQILDQWYDMLPHKHVKNGGRIHLVLQIAPTGHPPFVPYVIPQYYVPYPPQTCQQPAETGEQPKAADKDSAHSHELPQNKDTPKPQNEEQKESTVSSQ